MKNNKAYIITGPTSGIGYATALELAKHGTVIDLGFETLSHFSFAFKKQFRLNPSDLIGRGAKARTNN